MIKAIPYVCPSCHSSLTKDNSHLICGHCDLHYPLVNGIPDFLVQQSDLTNPHLLKNMSEYDKVSESYESSFWYPVLIRGLAGLAVPSLDSLVAMIHGIVVDAGSIIDIACGPGSLSRGLGVEDRSVHGIDVSMGMLSYGQTLLTDRERDHVYFARSKAESLPFSREVFDCGICGGAFSLFENPGEAVSELARVLRPGSRLLITSLFAGKAGLLRFNSMRRRFERKVGSRLYSLEAIENIVSENGFGDIESRIFGSLVLLRAVRQ